MHLGGVMELEITKQEAWKILDAVKAYSKDYTLTKSVDKTFGSIIEKLKKVVQE